MEDPSIVTTSISFIFSFSVAEMSAEIKMRTSNILFFTMSP